MSDQDPAEFTIRNGVKIPEFKAGKDGPSIWSASAMNRLVKFANAVLNFRVARGEKDEVKFSDANVLLTLTGGEGDGGSSIKRYQIASPTEARPTVIAGDYIVCRTWEGDTIGETDILVAKQYHLRHSITSQTIFGDTHGYSYGAGPDTHNKKRTHTASPDSQSEIVIPPWIPGQPIWAVNTDTGVTVDGTAVEWLMLHDGRQWAWMEDL